MTPMQTAMPLVNTKQTLLLDRIGTDVPAVHVLELLNVACRLIRTRDDLLRSLDMSDGRLGALLAVSAEPGIGPAALADKLGVTRATVTSLVDRLYKSGFVVRETDPDDRRSQVLQTSSAGEKKLAEVVPALADWLNAAGTRVTDADVGCINSGAAFRDVLHAIIED